MKNLALSLALSLAATTAFAGGVAEPTMQTEEVVANSASSQSGYIVPLLLLIALAVAASNKTTELQY